jgi:hypothetical protein
MHQKTSEMNRLGTSDIVEAEIISEESAPLGDGNDFVSWAARTADRLTSGNRGSWITEAIILAGYAKDKKQLRSAYQQNKPAIDAYFEQVDVEKVLNESGDKLRRQLSDGLQKKIKNYTPLLLGGTVLAAGTIFAIKKMSKS